MRRAMGGPLLGSGLAGAPPYRDSALAGKGFPLVGTLPPQTQPIASPLKMCPKDKNLELWHFRRWRRSLVGHNSSSQGDGKIAHPFSGDVRADGYIAFR